MTNTGRKFLGRLAYVVREWFVWATNSLQMLVGSITYLFFGGEKIYASESSSSKVGRLASRGNKFGLFAERTINRIIFWDPDHCRASTRRLRDLWTTKGG